MESGVWRSLHHWTRRRPIGVGPTEHPFAYAAAAAPALWIFVGLSAFEIPLLHFVLPWPAARIVFLLLGAWGLVWMLGFAASFYVHPHIVGDTGLRVRNSMLTDISIPWEAVAAVQPYRRTLASARTVQFEPGPSGSGIVHVAVSSMTNVQIELNRPVSVTVPKLGDQAVTVVRCYADDPVAYVALARERLADHISGSDHSPQP